MIANFCDRNVTAQMLHRFYFLNFILGATHSEAVSAMRETGNSIHLIVCDGWNKSPNDAAIQNGQSEVDDAAQQQPPRPNSRQEVFPPPLH